MLIKPVPVLHGCKTPEPHGCEREERDGVTADPELLTPESHSRLFPAPGAPHDIYLGTKPSLALPDSLMPKPHAGLFFLVSNARSNARGTHEN